MREGNPIPTNDSINPDLVKKNIDEHYIDPEDDEYDPKNSLLMKRVRNYLLGWMAGLTIFAVAAADKNPQHENHSEKSTKVSLNSTNIETPSDEISGEKPSDIYCINNTCIPGENIPKFLSNISDSLNNADPEAREAARVTIENLKGHNGFEDLIRQNPKALEELNKIERKI